MIRSRVRVTQGPPRKNLVRYAGISSAFKLEIPALPGLGLFWESFIWVNNDRVFDRKSLRFCVRAGDVIFQI
jgi:hypothetical protein